jgi:hypothetical protein
MGLPCWKAGLVNPSDIFTSVVVKTEGVTGEGLAARGGDGVAGRDSGKPHAISQDVRPRARMRKRNLVIRPPLVVL